MNSYNTTGNLANDPELKKVGDVAVVLVISTEPWFEFDSLAPITV